MKVRISYIVEVDDTLRREIAAYYGNPGLASREDIKRWYEQYGSSEDDNLAMSADQREEETS